MALKTNFTDDILAESMNGKRQYNVTENSNGTKSLEDVTDYQSVGSTFSAKDMNETNAAVNQAYDDMGDEFNKNTKYLAGAVKIHNNKLWKFKVDHDPGEWDESQVRKTTLLDEIGELTEKLAVVEVDMTSAKLNTNVSVSYPAGFYRKNCVIMGISVYDRVNNNYYSLFGDTTVTAMLGANVIVKTSQSNYIGAGSKIRVVLYKIA